MKIFFTNAIILSTSFLYTVFKLTKKVQPFQYETMIVNHFLKLLQSTKKGTSNLNVFLPSQFQTFPTVKVFLRFSL